VGSSAVSNGRGEFQVENVMPGKYAVFMVPQPNNEAWAEAVPFEVVDQDVHGLIVKAQKGAAITGILSLEGTNDKNLWTRLAQLRLQAVVRPEGLRSATVLTATTNPDLSFRVGGLQAGVVNFSLASMDLSRVKGFSILRVEREGMVQTPGVQVKTGEQVSGVRIVVGYGSGGIRGVVKIENGPLPPNARLGVRFHRIGEGPNLTRPVEVDARGMFLIEGIMAGSYEVTVTAFLPGIRSRSVEQQVNVSDGVTNEVSFVLDLKLPQPDPQPE
jgi:hypothetical protein